MVNEDASEKSLCIFKNSKFQPKLRFSSNFGKKRIWRSLKQIIVQERTLPWSADTIHYSLINAIPNFKPSKKYSDISGLLAHYTDPQSKLRYANMDEFFITKSLPMNIVAGYLALRGSSSVVG